MLFLNPMELASMEYEAALLATRTTSIADRRYPAALRRRDAALKQLIATAEFLSR